MKKILILSFVLCSISAKANIQLSDSSYISLLTCEPAEAIYARFWHSAIRVCDEKNNIDNAYNYGIFDFSTPYFIPKFIKGHTDYMLDVYPMEYFMSSYITRQSTVYEQILSLSQEEKQALFDALEENYRPENRVYRYNFVYDNCATRDYYIIKRILDQSGQTMVITYPNKNKSYRGVFEEFLGRDNWQRFAIDVVIGQEADSPITTESLIAFPKYTMDIMEATALVKDTINKPLVLQTNTLTEYPIKIPSENSIFRPTIVCSLLLIIVVFISFWWWRKEKYPAWLDFVLFLICGIMGSVVFYLMFLSTHPLVHYNYNLLWLNPLQLIFAFLLLNKKWRKPLSYFAIVNAFATLLAIIVFVTRFQIMHASFLALMAMMLVRSLLFYQQNINKRDKTI